MKNSAMNLLLILPFLLAAGLTCSNFGNNSKSNEKPANEAKPPAESKPVVSNKPAKLDGYSIRGVKFAYYKIPSGLKENELINIAQTLHDQDPDSQLVLVDDDKELADYINYAKAISGEGKLDKPMPMEWAEKHVIANVQKYTSGKFVLCKGYGYEEIADLK